MSGTASRQMHRRRNGGGQRGGRVRTPKVLLAALAAVSLAIAACGGSSDNNDKASTSSAPAKLSGSIDVWIMDPGSPAVQSVVNPQTIGELKITPQAGVSAVITVVLEGLVTRKRRGKK